MTRKKDFVEPISSVPHSGAQPLSGTGSGAVSQTRPSQLIFPAEEDPSAPRPREPSVLPPGFSERLLRLAWESPLDGGEDGAARALLDTLAELLPAYGLAAIYLRSSDATDGAASASVQIMRRLPAADIVQECGTSTPHRVFPELGHEAALSVPTDFGNVSLYAGADAPTFLEPNGLVMMTLRRAVLLFARNLHTVRANVDRGAREAKKVLAAQMVQADKLASLGQIAAGIVHELNNPLTSIVAYSEYLVKRWLARTDTVDALELERLQRISDSANRLLRFTRDLVTYARPASNVWMPISIHRVVDQAVLFCEHLLVDSKTAVVRSYVDGDLSVRGSSEQLTQVFVNLITNACHAMSAGGAITVTTDLEGDGHSVRVVVQDAGHGIEARHLGEVFSPFFTTKPAGSGTGLGLSIVKTIVDAHHGTIWAESEPQQGARFVIVLPRT